MPEIVVVHPPVPKARPRLGRGRIFTPRTTELAEARIRETWIAQIGGEPLTGPLSLSITVALARPIGHFGTGRNAGQLRPSAPHWPAGRPDWDNYAKTASDALNGVAYRDDGQVVRAHVVKRYASDSPHWVIRVAQLPNGGVE